MKGSGLLGPAGAVEAVRVAGGRDNVVKGVGGEDVGLQRGPGDKIGGGLEHIFLPGGAIEPEVKVSAGDGSRAKHRSGSRRDDEKGDALGRERVGDGRAREIEGAKV